MIWIASQFFFCQGGEIQDCAYLDSESTYSESELFPDEDAMTLAQQEVHHESDMDSAIESAQSSEASDVCRIEDKDGVLGGLFLPGDKWVVVLPCGSPVLRHMRKDRGGRSLYLTNPYCGRLGMPEGFRNLISIYNIKEKGVQVLLSGLDSLSPGSFWHVLWALTGLVRCVLKWRCWVSPEWITSLASPKT